MVCDREHSFLQRPAVLSVNFKLQLAPVVHRPPSPPPTVALHVPRRRPAAHAQCDRVCRNGSARSDPSADNAAAAAPVCVCARGRERGGGGALRKETDVVPPYPSAARRPAGWLRPDYLSRGARSGRSHSALRRLRQRHFGSRRRLCATGTRAAQSFSAASAQRPDGDLRGERGRQHRYGRLPSGAALRGRRSRPNFPEAAAWGRAGPCVRGVVFIDPSIDRSIRRRWEAGRRAGPK